MSFVRLLAAHLGWSSSDRVLDLGAGPAHVSLRLAPFVGAGAVEDEDSRPAAPHGAAEVPADVRVLMRAERKPLDARWSDARNARAGVRVRRSLPLVVAVGHPSSPTIMVATAVVRLVQVIAAWAEKMSIRLYALEPV